MVEIGGRPILWHIMKHYARHGLRRVRASRSATRATSSSASSSTTRRCSGRHDGRPARRRDRAARREHARTGPSTSSRPGSDTNTGGRVGRLAPTSATARSCSRTATASATSTSTRCSRSTAPTAGSRRSPPCARRRASAAWSFDGDARRAFTEKPQMGEGWINGGFFVLEPQRPRLHRRRRDELRADAAGAARRARASCVAYRHDGFWQAMDTLREVRFLRSLWDRGEAPWVTW